MTRYKSLLIIACLLCIGGIYKTGYFDKITILSRHHVPSKYVWCLGFAHASDVTFRGKNRSLHKYMHPEKIHKGDIVWVESKSFPTFVREYMPRIRYPFVLILTHGDESFPGFFEKSIDVESFLSDARVLHVFAQNCDYKGSSSKVSPLPIGLDLHTMENKKGGFGEKKTSAKEQEEKLEKIVARLKPTYQRKKRALVDFQLNNTMKAVNKMHLIFHEDRETIFKKIIPSGVIDVNPSRIARSELWKKKGEYAFSICPPGNGYDTHRAWEDLILGCIVIVKSSPLDALYQGLPVVIVNDWSEVSEANFTKWLALYGDAFTNPKYREKLSHRYWMNHIIQVRDRALASTLQKQNNQL